MRPADVTDSRASDFFFFKSFMIFFNGNINHCMFVSVGFLELLILSHLDPSGSFNGTLMRKPPATIFRSFYFPFVLGEDSGSAWTCFLVGCVFCCSGGEETLVVKGSFDVFHLVKSYFFPGRTE